MQHSDGAQQQEGRLSTTPSSIAAVTAITTSHPAVTVSQLRVAGRVPVVTAASAIGMVAAAGQQGVLSTVAGGRPVAMSPQAVMVPAQTVSRLLSPSTSLSANTLQIPATLNVLQRQLSAPGIVGLSAVSAQDLQQVLQQASQQSITLLTATEAVSDPQQRPRLARPLSFPHSSPSLPAVSSVSATGATIHHHGQSPVRGAVPVMAATLSHSNLQHSLLGMNLNTQQQQQLSAAAVQRRVATTTATTTTTITTSAIAVIPAANITAQSRTVFEVRAPSGQPPSLRTASGAPPRKKMRLEEKQPPNAEVGNYRKQLVELKHKQMKELKSEYFENLTEMFFLQSGQNLMDYHNWKKRPTPQLVSFLTSGKLDSDEEEDVLQVKEINSEVKVLTNLGSNVPLATPVAISTTLPPRVSALSQQGSNTAVPAPSSHRTNTSPAPAPSSSGVQSPAIQLFLSQLSAYVKGSEHRSSSHRPVCLPGFSHSLSAAFSVVAPSAQTASAGSCTTLSTTASHAITSSSPFSSATASATATSSSQLQQQLSKTLDSRPANKGQLSSKQLKSPPLSPNQRLHTRQQSLSAVYDNLSGSSQEVIVERAKQEAQVVQRVAELRKEGLWSSKRLPRVQEPSRQKAHWDYLLEEMTWLAADFIQERKWKKVTARKVARMVSNYFKEQEQKELKAEKEEATKLKKIASHMAKMVKEFWTNIEKVVQYKQQMRLDEKKKRALDLHLNFIVDQTEKYSTWLTEGLQNASSVNGSHSTSPSHSSDGEDFQPSDNSTDDEETIQKEEDEAEGNELDEKQELEDLQKEGDLPLQELLKTLPQEVLDAPAPLPPLFPEGPEEVDSNDDDEKDDENVEEGKEVKKEESVEKEGSSKSSGGPEGKEGSDKEFTAAEEDAMDVEDTIDEQEKQEKRNYKNELQDLAEEGEMSIEELAAKYAGAYDSDFELPQDSSSEEEDDDSELESDEFEIETGSSSSEETSQKEEEKEKEESLGLEALMKPPQDPSTSVPSTSAPSTSAPSTSAPSTSAPSTSAPSTSAPSTSAAPQPTGSVKKEEKEEVINDIAAQALSLQPKGYTLETTEVRTKVPFLLKHKLREYQHVGLDWLATMHDKHLNGILADEMGLGKTIQTIALLAHLACEKGTWGPHLIVVPTSVMLNWELELKKWCPAFKILTYYGNQKERKLKRQGWTKTNAFHVCITSYKLVVQDHQAFRRKKWKYLILDEAQNIKNFKSQRWQMLLNFSSQRRLLLTGTPLQNSLMELWSLMHFLMPHVFQSHRDFKEWFANPLTGMIEGSQEYNESLIKRLHKVLRPFLLRRLKNEVEKQMPQKYEHVVMCRLSKRQRFLYDDFMSQSKTRETLASGHYMSVINILMQLRKVCNHPNLFDPRPVVSPLSIEGLTYSTASMVTTALRKDPLEEVDIRTLFPSLAEMEHDLPAFVAHRVKQLTTAPALIEEIDYHPDPTPPLPKGQLKPGAFPPLTVPLLQRSDRASPVIQGRAGSPVDTVKTAGSRSATPPVITAVPRPVSSLASVPATSMPSTLAFVPATPATLSMPTTVPLNVSIAGTTVSQVRSSTGQTLLLTGVTRSGVSSALMLTTTPSAAVAAATGVTCVAVGSTPATVMAAPLTSTLQAKVLPQPSQGSVTSSSGAMLSSQPITLQIQQTNQGTRVMIPTGQLSQLPANLFQIVQTSSGQHLVATSTPTSSIAVLPVTSTASTVNGPLTLTTVAATVGQGLVTTAVSQLKTLTAFTTPAPAITPAPTPTIPTPTTTTTPTSSSAATTTCPAASSAVVTSSSASKPVMRVSPMVASTSSGTVVTTTIAAPSTTTTTTSSSLPLSVVSSVVSTLKSVMSPKKRSEMFSELVYEKRKQRRKEKLKRLARVNVHHCSQAPVYGPDLIQTLNLAPELCGQCQRGRHWLRVGHANCQAVHTDHNRNLPAYYWHETNHLSDMIRTPEQYLSDLKEVLNRFAFCIPSVISPGIQLRVAHPDPSDVLRQKRLAFDVHEQLRPVTTRLNDLRMRMSIHFPELRLIQYDCGKLQTMDVLLRDLKTGDHRVLIFTQMTKMLDVLEAFLNYHGHRYLRLDGTTKVEQRQALMDRFNADRRIFCFILSTRSGGIGVNLTGADTVIFYDSDWNPTMDAQAQDRCHRIGQTRDVHIYRLISEMTVEENILKKANQKRLLGDLAIEGGNFTTAFFKEQTIKDLFAQPSGLKSLTEEKEMREVKVSQGEAMETEEAPPVARKTGGKDKEANIVAAFEQALCKAEDETDAMAATLVKAEQKAELADFDESIPWDEKEAEARKEEDEMSRAEIELAMLDKELSGIERYAVGMMETQMEDDVLEELKMAEEDMENSKKDWELTRLKALKEEEERRAKIEEDEMLYTYLLDEAQVKKQLTKAGAIRKKPGRPRIHPPRSPSLSTSDTGSTESKPPKRVRNRAPAKPKNVPGVGRGRRKAVGEGEKKGKAEIVKKPGGAAGVKGKVVTPMVEKGEPVQNGPVKLAVGSKSPVVGKASPQVGKKSPQVKPKKNNVAQKSLLNGEAGEKEEVGGVPKRRKKAAAVKSKQGEEGEKPATPVPKPRPVGRPSKAAAAAAKAAAAGLTPGPRAILKVPTMTTTTTQGPSTPINSPPLKSLPQANPVTSPVSSPSNVPPPWSNPNLVIRTRRANIHSPVQVSNRPVVPGVSAGPAGVLQQTGLVQQVQQVGQPIGVVQSGGVVRLVSPGPMVALASSQPLQVVTAGRVRPTVAVSLPSQLSLAGARVLGTTGQLGTARLVGTPAQQVIGSGTSLAGARVLTSQAGVVNASVSLAGARLINASAAHQAISAQSLMGARMLTAGGSVGGAKVLSTAQQVLSAGGTLAGTRMFNASGQQVVSASSLQGSLIRLPDGSTAVLGQIGGANLMAAAQSAGSPTLLVSGTSQNPSGARAVLASNLTATGRQGASAIRLAGAQPLVNATGVRTLQLGTARLTAPVTLRGMGSVPLGVNLVKAGTSGVQIPLVGGQGGASGMSIPIMGAQGLALRGGQIIQTNLGQAASPQSFVLITPRAATPNPVSVPNTSVNGSAEKKGAG
ncbi:hypothetical protein ACOMHN_031013 [Nucella lapillus]